MSTKELSTNGTGKFQSKSAPKQRDLCVSIVDDEFDDRLLMEWVISQSAGFRLSGSHASAQEALTDIPAKTPDVVLMDIRMPGISGIECLRRLKVILPSLIVVLVSGLNDAKTMLAAREAGGDGYLTKPFTAEQCLATLRYSCWRKGSIEYDPFQSSFARDRAKAQLTNLENQVMECLANGLLYKEVADHLHISYTAVHKCQHRIFLKLHAGNRTEAVAKWRIVGAG